MKPDSRQSGLTLIEQTVIIAIAAMLLYFGLPAARTLFDQMHTPAGVKATISSALASAKAIAAKRQCYAGIRFQHAYYEDAPEKSPLNQPQYIIFIVHDFDKTGLANGFMAVEGLEPIKLPEHIGVMDLFVNEYEQIDDNGRLNDDMLIDATTFSIVFSPAGKLLVRDVQTRNRDGEPKSSNDSEDDIFNVEENVEDGIAMFLQDDYEMKYNLYLEPSRRSFLIYNRNEFKTIKENRRYSDYIERFIQSETIYLNPYTGTMIKR